MAASTTRKGSKVSFRSRRFIKSLMSWICNAIMGGVSFFEIVVLVYMEMGGNAIGWGGRDCGKIARQPFPYLCSDGSRTLRLLCPDIIPGCLLKAVLFFGQGLFISDGVCVNSRTHDIGKA